TSVTLFVRPAVFGVFDFCDDASDSNVASGTASTRPSPNSGVVNRPARTLASAGTVSPLNVHSPAGPMPVVWISEPPSLASGSKTPLVVRPKRVSTVVPAPPVAPALWHAAHETSLNTGPRP